jgi:hypothetical protein
MKYIIDKLNNEVFVFQVNSKNKSSSDLLVYKSRSVNSAIQVCENLNTGGGFAGKFPDFFWN